MQIRELTKTDAPKFRALRLRALEEYPTVFSSSYEIERHWPLEAFADRLPDTPAQPTPSSSAVSSKAILSAPSDSFDLSNPNSRTSVGSPKRTSPPSNRATDTAEHYSPPLYNGHAAYPDSHSSI